MPWSYSATAFFGNKATPAKGNYVTVQIANPDSPERYRYLTFTFDGKKTRAQFVTMVKAEIRATLDLWNNPLPEVDATNDFEVTALTMGTMEVETSSPPLTGEGIGERSEPKPAAPAGPTGPQRTKTAQRTTVRPSSAKAKG